MSITSSLSDAHILLVEPAHMQANMVQRMLGKLGAADYLSPSAELKRRQKTMANLVTSKQNQRRLAAVERAGVSLVCDKPFDITTIRRLIGEAMNR